MTARMLDTFVVDETQECAGPTSGELFAGVGGLGMAVDEVFGTKPAWFCEFDAAPSKVLAHHFPDVPNYGDVTKVDWTAAPRVHVLAGGFPCQDVSLAGARRGMQDGTRSGLWSEYAKAIEALRPDWVVIENVRGLLSADGEPWHPDLIEADAEVRQLDQLIRMVDRFLHENPARRREGRTPHVVEWRRAAVRLARSRKRAVRVRDRERGLVRRAIDTVLRDLADLRFDAEWVGLPASDVGAPHGRFRVFILAWPQERTPAADADRDGLGAVGRVESVGHDAHGRGCADEARLGSQSSAPAPDADDRPRGGERSRAGSRRGGAEADVLQRDRVTAIATLVGVVEHALLPTPQVADATGGHATRSGDRSDEKLLPGAAVDAATGWGPYAAAIARWEATIGRAAPSPVRMDGKGGKARLNPELTEWMMGWPAGWVTASVIDLSRAEQLKACGNGVVTQQAIAALRIMLARPGVPRIEWELPA